MINDILHLPTASVFGTSPDPRRPQLTCNSSSDLTTDVIADVTAHGQVDNNSSTSGDIPSVTPAMAPPHGYQISLTPGVPNHQGQGLRHELILTENSHPQTAARRSQRVAKRPRVKHSKKEGIIVPTSQLADRTTPITKVTPLSNNSTIYQLKSKLKGKCQQQQVQPEVHHQTQAQIPDHQLAGEVATSDPNNDGTYDDVNEQKIVHATIQAFQTGSLTPLIKEELRCTIQSRRLAQGKGELKVEFKTPPKRKEMTDEERRRAGKRKIQNREAAQRFRQRQKDTGDYLTAKIAKLQENSETLMADLESLKQERDDLQEMLRAHLLVCSHPDSLAHQHDEEATNHSEADPCLDDVTTVEIYTTNRVTTQLQPSEDSTNRNSLLDFNDNGIVIEPDSELSQMLENSHGFYYAADDSHHHPHHHDVMSQLDAGDVMEECGDGDAVKTLSNFPDDICYTDLPPEVCYEEIVMDEEEEEEEMAASDYGKHRLDSCSSVATYDSYLSESHQSLCGESLVAVPDFGQSSRVFRDVTESLSDSTCDVRHSISSAYSRVHMDSTSSEVFEMRLLDQDFLLSGDETP